MSPRDIKCEPSVMVDGFDWLSGGDDVHGFGLLEDAEIVHVRFDDCPGELSPVPVEVQLESPPCSESLHATLLPFLGECWQQ